MSPITKHPHQVWPTGVGWLGDNYVNHQALHGRLLNQICFKPICIIRGSREPWARYPGRVSEIGAPRQKKHGSSAQRSQDPPGSTHYVSLFHQPQTLSTYLISHQTKWKWQHSKHSHGHETSWASSHGAPESFHTIIPSPCHRPSGFAKKSSLVQINLYTVYIRSKAATFRACPPPQVQFPAQNLPAPPASMQTKNEFTQHYISLVGIIVSRQITRTLRKQKYTCRRWRQTLRPTMCRQTPGLISHLLMSIMLHTLSDFFIPHLEGRLAFEAHQPSQKLTHIGSRTRKQMTGQMLELPGYTREW